MKCPIEGEDAIRDVNSVFGTDFTFEQVWDAARGSSVLDYVYEDAERDAQIEGYVRGSSKFMDRVQEIVLDEVSETLRDLPSMMRSLRDEPVIYRAMVIDDIDNFIREVRRFRKSSIGCIGVFWAWDIDHAIVYDADHPGEEYILVAKIELEDVDVKETIVSYITYSMLGRESDKENEITLKDGSIVWLEAIVEKKSGQGVSVGSEICV